MTDTTRAPCWGGPWDGEDRDRAAMGDRAEVSQWAQASTEPPARGCFMSGAYVWVDHMKRYEWRIATGRPV